MCANVVSVKEGKLKGFVAKNNDGGEYLAFRGVPYAEPPIGNLRLKDPQPPKPWYGLRDVGDFSPKAAQVDMMTGLNSGNEDCLYLNIATLSLREKRPVMVWIHGGGFVQGGPNGDLYGPDFLIKHDIVFVAITYRLGCLGFLNLNMPEAAGNQGLKDQVAALKWIKKNIHAFGGDPENVTIFGQSAGSASVHLLTVSPLAKGLFHKAIAQSGTWLGPWAYETKQQLYAGRLVRNMGKYTDDPEEILESLMSATTDELMDAQRQLTSGNINVELEYYFVPTVDSSSTEPFMPEPPHVMWKYGIDYPLLIGYVSEEGIICSLDPNLEDDFRVMNTNFAKSLIRTLKHNDPKEIESIAESVRKFYFGNEPITLKTKKYEFVKMKGDIHFINGIQRITDLQMEKSTPTYIYKYSYIANFPTFRTIFKSNVNGVCHGDEIGAFFHGSIMIRNRTYPKGSRDRLTMERMTKMWTNFAKTGNPTPEVNEVITCKWEPVTKTKKNYIEIGNDIKPGVDPDKASWDFWKNILASQTYVS